MASNELYLADLPGDKPEMNTKLKSEWICIYPLSLLHTDQWQNYSSHWNNSLQFDEYACRAGRARYINEKCSSVDAHIFLICGLIGLTSAVSSLIIFNKIEFSKCLAFVMYKIIAYLDLIHMIVMILLGLRYFFDCDSSFSCQFATAHFGTFLSNTCAEIVDFIVLFLCIERTIACLFPVYFNQIHNKRIFLIVTIVAVLLTSAMNAPLIFQLKVKYDEQSKKYKKTMASFGRSHTYRILRQTNLIRLCLMGALITFATFTSIVGLIKARRNRAKFQTGKRNSDTGRNDNLLEMCVLQLCLALPTVLNYGLLAAMKIGRLERPYLVGYEVFKQKLQFDVAMREVWHYEIYQIIKSAVLASNLLAHAFHFYFYILFSWKIRRSALDSLKRCKTNIENLRKRSFERVPNLEMT